LLLADHSNTVNASELKNLVYDLGFYPDDAEIGAILRALDKDRSGYVFSS
jgi:Ca2+-binding EF-hand superfamily protein